MIGIALIALGLVAPPSAAGQQLLDRGAPIASSRRLATQEVAADEDSLSGEAEGGIIATSGNTTTRSWNVKLGAELVRGLWSQRGRIELLRASDDGETTAQRFVLTARSGYDVADAAFLFASVRYENDRFSGFEYRVTERVGYGRRLLRGDRLELDAEVGVGSRQSRFADGSSATELLFHAGSALWWKISDAAELKEELDVDSGGRGTVTQSLTSLTATIVGDLAMRLSFNAKHTSEVPPGIEKLDTVTAANLVYSF